MKKTYLMLLLGLVGFVSGCTNEDGSEGSTPSGNPGEIRLVFSGSGESEEYTKAIASDSENKIGNLKVYLFGAPKADAVDSEYEYVETWTMTDAAPGAGQFVLQPSGSSWTASIKPNEKKGLPYLTLVCVANQDKPFNADGTEMTALDAVATDATGAITTHGTTLAAFKAAYTAKLAPDGIIKTPLVMTGTGTTKISGSVSKVAITLKRMVARFDIDNTTATSQLTITSVAMGQGRPNGSLFGATLANVADPTDPASGLITYADVNFKGENANQGTLESAVYVYPNLSTDLSYLIIKGTYKSPSTGEQIPVTYNIPVVKTPAEAKPTDPANYIAIDANSRYKLRITDVTESNIYSTFEVEDWTSGGGVIIKPENAKPEFKEFSGTDQPTVITGEYYRTADAGTFNIVMTSTGELECSRSLVTKAGEIDWLTVGNVTKEQKDGLTITTFPVTITGATGKRPVSLTFINQAASYDPDLQRTLTFVGPEATPVLSEVVKGHSEGNSVDLAAPTAPKATMVNAVGSYVSVSLFCVDGIADITSPTGYSVTEVATEGFTTTYRVAITDASTAADGTTIDFKNKAADANKVTLTIEHKKASQPKIVANDNGSYTNSPYNDGTIGGTAGAVTADMYLIDGSTIYVKATCTESVAAGAVKVDALAGVTVAEETAAPGIFKIEIPAAASLTAGTAVAVTFKNATDETVTSTLEITPKSAKPTVSLADSNPTSVTDNNDGSYTIDATALSTNTFTLTVTAPTGAGIADLSTPFTGGGWLKLSDTNAGETSIDAGGNQVYTFTGGDTAGESGDVTLTFTNTVSDGGDLTVTLKKKI
ncbi:DUF4906 domain-containing protein [Parabacteroides sp. AF18-52]|jgi:hypothetical protein|uniref:DUF4906 domain-containing protein n=1 Tax=Parabacteroides TaxID=375288 RepID=UPI000EFE373A|nr:DUF4906 domain-containing protein [Parabacteroides sp. AF18-52]RHR34082.1 DUF4906 domain-containing protein [Parabacteroides sp. AF18-52]